MPWKGPEGPLPSFSSLGTGATAPMKTSLSGSLAVAGVATLASLEPLRRALRRGCTGVVKQGAFGCR